MPPQRLPLPQPLLLRHPPPRPHRLKLSRWAPRAILVLVGVIVGAHGIKGEVKLKSFTSDPLSIGRYGPLQSSSGKQFEISKLKAAKDDFIASLKNVNDRNEAETLKGVELFVAREKLPKLKTHEAYAHDLMGLDVVLENGTTLGKLVGMPELWRR